MFHSRILNNKINRLLVKELCVGIISLNLMNYWRKMALSVSVIEIFKRWLLKYSSFIGLSPQIMTEVFQIKSPAPYYLRDKNELYSRNPKTVKYGTESVSFMAPKIWSKVPQEMKNYQSVYFFKNKIRKWKPKCPCRFCKTCLEYVGLL